MKRFLEWLDAKEKLWREGETLGQVQEAEERKWLAIGGVEMCDQLLEKTRRLMHEHGNQQFVVRPNTTHKNEGLTADEVDRLRTEQAVAGLGGVPWSVRSQSANHRRAWRGQLVRKGLQGGVIRAAKRGGRFKVNL